MRFLSPDGFCLRSTTMALVLAIAFGCSPPTEMDPDAGPPEDAMYPIHTDPEDGEDNVLIDKVLRLTYEDHIDSTTLSQSQVSIYSGPLYNWTRFFYDPVRGQLVVWSSRYLRRDVTWVLALGEDIQDIEGGPVAWGDIIHFSTGSETGDNTPYVVPSFENEVLPIFTQHCASCHSSATDGFAGLELGSMEEIAETAINSESDGWAGRPVIAPFLPGNSYILYKIIGDPRVAGLPMPRTPDLDGAAAPIPFEEQELLADWIASGAQFFDSEASQD